MPLLCHGYDCALLKYVCSFLYIVMLEKCLAWFAFKGGGGLCGGLCRRWRLGAGMGMLESVGFKQLEDELLIPQAPPRVCEACWLITVGTVPELCPWMCVAPFHHLSPCSFFFCWHIPIFFLRMMQCCENYFKVLWRVSGACNLKHRKIVSWS